LVFEYQTIDHKGFVTWECLKFWGLKSADKTKALSSMAACELALMKLVKVHGCLIWRATIAIKVYFFAGYRNHERATVSTKLHFWLPFYYQAIASLNYCVSV
jgi:hypothetical protein